MKKFIGKEIVITDRKSEKIVINASEFEGLTNSSYVYIKGLYEGADENDANKVSTESVEFKIDKEADELTFSITADKYDNRAAIKATISISNNI